jgi:phosphatidylserine synthase
MRRAERDERRMNRSRGDWGGLPIGGVIILLVGLIFLARNFGLDMPDNWWAIFILIPAAATLVSAVRFYRVDGTMSARAWGSAVGGVLMLAIALALFFGANWGVFWPVILIIVGVGIVFRGWRQG